jgi:hypothetical protein
MSEILIEQRELFGLGRRFGDDPAPVRDAVERAEAGHSLHRRLAESRREVRTIPVSRLVARHQLRSMPGQDRQKTHALDRVEGGLALDFEVVDVSEPGLGGFHPAMLEQMFALNKLGCARPFQ